VVAGPRAASEGPPLGDGAQPVEGDVRPAA
jgi:hypothetical protein